MADLKKRYGRGREAKKLVATKFGMSHQDLLTSHFLGELAEKLGTSKQAVVALATDLLFEKYGYPPVAMALATDPSPEVIPPQHWFLKTSWGKGTDTFEVIVDGVRYSMEGVDEFPLRRAAPAWMAACILHRQAEVVLRRIDSGEVVARREQGQQGEYRDPSGNWIPAKVTKD